MPWGVVAAGVISAGASAYGASKQAGAAKDAAGQQQDAANRQMGLDANVFNAQAAMQLPARELGGLAQNRLGFLMGLTPNLDISPDFATPNINPNPGSGPGLTWNGPSSGYGWNNTGSGNPNAPGGNPYMQPSTYNGITPVAGGNSGGLQGVLAGASGATTGGTPAMSTAMGSPTGSGPGGFGPIAPAGAAGGFGSLGNPYDPSTFFQSPDYNFIQDQASKGLARAGAASGQLGTGAQLKAAMDYSSGLASQEFGNAFNRSMTTQQNTFNELNALGTGGQVATNATGSAAGQFGTAASGAIGAYGNAGAAGTIGAGNAVAGGINGVANGLGSVFSQYQNGGFSNPFASSNPSGYTPNSNGTVNSPYTNLSTGLENGGWNTQPINYASPYVS